MADFKINVRIVDGGNGDEFMVEIEAVDTLWEFVYDLRDHNAQFYCAKCMEGPKQYSSMVDLPNESAELIEAFWQRGDSNARINGAIHKALEREHKRLAELAHNAMQPTAFDTVYDD